VAEEPGEGGVTLAGELELATAGEGGVGEEGVQHVVVTLGEVVGARRAKGAEWGHPIE